MKKTVMDEARVQKMDFLKEKIDLYPDRFDKTHELQEVIKLDDGAENVKVAGRITFMRKMGKLSFINISDVFGKLQIAFMKDMIGDEQYELFKKGYDIGDFIGVEGIVFTTKTGEKTLKATDVTFLGKSLRTLPEKFHGISDIDSCYRQRYLDLIMNQKTRERFLLKFNFIKEVRRFLEDNGYIEIETPVIINKPSGASARAFTSHHNALDMDVYLSIAPETYLKRAIVGGFNKVFEFARCFRNEGMDATHLQDFTMLEGYCAYYNYRDNMQFLKSMLTNVVKKLLGETRIVIEDKVIEFDTQWPIVTFRDLIYNDCGIDIEKQTDADGLRSEIQTRNIELDSETNIELLGKGAIIDLLYKKVSRPKIIEPTFLIEHPKSLSPLARANDDNPNIVDRFQLIINGAEVINAYSELVDPIDQRNRFAEQAELRTKGDDEAMAMDNDYLTSMEYGMPPISGWGMGIDRMLQVLTGQDNIRDLVLFPLMRPKE